MNNLKHTDGNWAAYYDGNEYEVIIDSNEAPAIRTTICQVSKRNPEEDEANAKIMAASKELLMSVKDLTKRLELAYKHPNINLINKLEVEKSIADANLIIDKATK